MIISQTQLIQIQVLTTTFAGKILIRTLTTLNLALLGLIYMDTFFHLAFHLINLIVTLSQCLNILQIKVIIILLVRFKLEEARDMICFWERLLLHQEFKFGSKLMVVLQMMEHTK